MPVLLTLFVGRYAMRFDLRMVASVAFVVMGITCFLRSGFNLDIDFNHVAMMQLLMGLGVALFFMPVTVILLSDLGPNEIASGGGLATFARTLGGSLAASLTTFIWGHRAVLHHAHLTESITPYDPIAQAAISQLGRGNEATGASIINGMITQQGLQISFNELFYALGWIFISLVFVIWLAKPPFSASSGAAAAGH
jgi:DHA2 family multidrug resistance protein